METGVKHRLVTVEDLDMFKSEITALIRQLLSLNSTQRSRKWLKSAEVRKRIGISPGKLQTIRESGLLPYTKIGGNIYYDEEDLFKLFNDYKTTKKK